jgi:hypothetical protein
METYQENHNVKLHNVLSEHLNNAMEKKREDIIVSKTTKVVGSRLARTFLLEPCQIQRKPQCLQIQPIQNLRARKCVK